MQSNTSNSSPIVEGIDGQQVSFRERLLPGPYSWLLVAVMTISLGIAYGDVYGTLFGLLLALLSTLGVYLIMFFSSPIIQIDELVLRVGNARMPKVYLKDPEILDETQTQNSRRIAVPRNAYLVMRASIPQSILVQISDPTDPHPFWQFSSRKPELLIKALNEGTSPQAQ